MYVDYDRVILFDNLIFFPSDLDKNTIKEVISTEVSRVECCFWDSGISYMHYLPTRWKYFVMFYMDKKCMYSASEMFHRKCTMELYQWGKSLFLTTTRTILKFYGP